MGNKEKYFTRNT